MNVQPADAIDRAKVLASAAATDPSRWDAALQAIGDLCGADGASLFRPALDPLGRELNISTGFFAAGRQAYFSHWVSQDPLSLAIAGTNRFTRAGDVRFSREFVPEDDFRRTAYFNEFARHVAPSHKITLKICDARDPFSPVTHLALGRLYTKPVFEVPDKERLLALWPHLRRAIQDYWILRRARDSELVGSEALDGLPVPVWVVRSGALIDYANTKARGLMSSTLWIRATAGRLQGVGDHDAAALEAAIRFADLGVAQMLAVVYVEQGTLRRATLRVAPLAESSFYARCWPHARALLMLDIPTTPEGSNWMDRVAAHHRLTQAEQEVLAGLVAGQTVTQIAEAKGIFATTVRTHLRALFAKTGCRRQAELIRLVLGS